MTTTRELVACSNHLTKQGVPRRGLLRRYHPRVNGICAAPLPPENNWVRRGSCARFASTAERNEGADWTGGPFLVFFFFFGAAWWEKIVRVERKQATHLDVGAPASEIHQREHILRVHTRGVSEIGALHLAPYVLVVHGARPTFFLTLSQKKKEKPTSQNNNTRTIWWWLLPKKNE